MRATKAALKKLKLNDVFASEGDIVDGRSDHIIIQQQRQIWENIKNYPIVQSNAYLRQLVSYIMNCISLNQYNNHNNDKSSIKLLYTPHIVNAERFNEELNKDTYNIIAFALASIAGKSALTPAGDDTTNAMLVSIKAGVYKTLLSGVDLYRDDVISAANKYDESASKFEQKFADFDLRMKIVENLYTNKIKLESSYTYMNDKCKNHKIASIGFGLTSITMIMIPIILIYRLGLDGISNEINKITDGKIYIYGIIIASIIGGWAWSIRIVSRVFMQNMALWADAGQRAVLVRLFLALQKEGGMQADEKERILLLNALFRPIGETKDDDLSPPSLVDFIQKAK
jgi:hypothetical protein